MPVIDRLRNNSEPQENGCWIWQRYVTPAGYGQMNINGRLALTHRASYEAFIGPIAKGLCVCHSCDTPSCVNPDHLFLGTQADNMRDAREKGRAYLVKPPLGAGHPQAKLNDDAVKDIRTGRLSHTQFAELYGVARGTIGFVASGKTWTHI